MDGDWGTWSKLQRGDACAMCRRSRKGATNSSFNIVGIDEFDDSVICIRTAKPPNPDRPVCKYGVNCYRWNPTHHAEYNHPWLNAKGAYQGESPDSESERCTIIPG